MPLAIRLFSREWRSAVREFNARLDAAGVAPGMRLPEQPDTELLPGSELYLVLEDSTVRGGYVLRPQQFCFRGEFRRVTHYRLPLSEGIIDKRYAAIGPMMLRRAMAAEPLLYALGMGGAQQPLPRMLQAMGWKLEPVPFYFRVVHPARFLRGIRAARTNWWRAALMDLAAWTGAGWLGLRILRARTGREACPTKPVDDLGSSADTVWDASCREYAMSGVRDAAVLRRLYPASSPRFLRLNVMPAGWAAVLDTPMRDDRFFGDLRVGTIVDCLAKPEDAAAVIQAARLYLERRGVDLIISNQAHAAWTEALRRDGFFEGPSNFLFGASPRLAAIAPPLAEMHLNRGDGDGPVHL